MSDSSILLPAQVVHGAHGPRSLDYDDIYYASDGRNEAERVFINPLELESAFRTSLQSSIRIGELGFGTGLNFLAVCEKFLETAPPTARLNYIAFEKHPLARPDLERVVRSHRPAFSVAEELLAALPRLLAGWHKRYLYSGRISLSLYFGDALQGVSELGSKCHAWLLDGFDPKCNPDMWSPPLLKAVAQKSESSAKLATFSAQGELKRNLASLGFEVRRVDQRPYKRHSLLATLRAPVAGSHPIPKEVGIIGAGFAGLFSAHLLALRGISVEVFDSNPAVIPVALAHARVGDPSNTRARLHAIALDYSNHWYRNLGCAKGVFEVAKNARDRLRMARRAEQWKPAEAPVSFLVAKESRELTGLACIGEGLWHPQCHWPHRSLLNKLLNLPQITLHQTRVLRCSRQNGAWCLELQSQPSRRFSHLVVCAGAASVALLPQLDAYCVEGQMELARSDQSLPVALVGEGFIAPLPKQRFALGATYEHEILSEQQAREENMARARNWLAKLGGKELPSAESSWRGMRLYHQDRMPIIGEAQPGLFLNTAHGSAGSLLAPLGAEMVASTLTQDPPPLASDLTRRVLPTR